MCGVVLPLFGCCLLGDVVWQALLLPEWVAGACWWIKSGWLVGRWGVGPQGGMRCDGMSHGCVLCSVVVVATCFVCLPCPVVGLC